MNFQSVLIIASACIVLTMTVAEKTMDDIVPKLNMLNSKIYSNNLLSIERHDPLLRKKRSDPLNNLVAKAIDLEEINKMLPVDMGDIDHEGKIAKRHACSRLRNRWNHFRSGYENNDNLEKAKDKDSSEESGEVNTEDPSYVESAEIAAKKEETSTEKPKKVNNDKQRRNNSKHDSRHNDKESKNKKKEEDDEAENKKRKESEENADDEEYIFMNAPPAVAAKKENKNRRESENRKNNRVERDVIEEENVATTAPGFKYTSGYGDFGSKVSFRNINI